MGKSFLTYEQQIEKLINDKDLIVKDKDFLKKKLKEFGYFNLIGGYKNPFRDPMTRKYVKDTSFEDVLALYNLDVQLRKIFLQRICHIERSIANSMAYYFCDVYGDDENKYPKKGSTYVQGKKDLFSVAIAFRYLLPKDDFNRFKRDLRKALHEYFKASNRLTEAEIYSEMGFPENWESITRYRK